MSDLPSRDDWPEYVQRVVDGYGIDYQEAADIIALAFPRLPYSDEGWVWPELEGQIAEAIKRYPDSSAPSWLAPVAAVRVVWEWITSNE